MIPYHYKRTKEALHGEDAPVTADFSNEIMRQIALSLAAIADALATKGKGKEPKA